MDYEERKKKVNDEFIKVEQQINQLIQRRAELVGQYKLLQELEKKEEVVKDAEVVE